MKMTNLLRKTCAWVLAIGMTLMPVLPGTFAEEGSNPTATPVVEATATPTPAPTPVPTEAPTAVPTETPAPSEAPEGTEGTPSTEPSLVPSVEPSVEPSLEPSLEPSVEPSVEPTEEAMMALMGDAVPRGTITADVDTIVLFGGNWTLWVIEKDGYTGNFSYIIEPEDEDVDKVSNLTITVTSEGLNLTAAAVTKKQEFTITAMGDSTLEGTLPECKVTLLPRPTSIAFKGLSDPLELSLSVAQGFDFKYDSESKLRYKLSGASDVAEDEYEDLVTFSSSDTSKIAIDKESGKITVKNISSTIWPVSAVITIWLKDSSSGTHRSSTIRLNVYNDPKRIKITESPATIQMNEGEKHTLSFQLYDEDGKEITLNSAVKLESSDDFVVYCDDTITFTADGPGTAEVTATIRGTGQSASCTVNVRAVPDSTEVGLETQTGISVWEAGWVDDPTSGPGHIKVGKGETLTLVPTLIDLARTKYIGTVTVNSANPAIVKVDTTTLTDGRKAVTIKGVATSKTDTSYTDVIITVNGDLADHNNMSKEVQITVPILVTANPTGLALNKATASVCVKDSFILTVTPTPDIFARYTVTAGTAGMVKIEELEHDDPDAPDVKENVAIFKITALKQGTVTLTVTIAGTTIKKTCVVTIGKAPTAATFGNTAPSICVGSEYQLKAYFGSLETTLTEGEFVFSTDSDKITVDPKTGVVRALEVTDTRARVIATAVNYDIEATCNITVTEKPTSINFASGITTLDVAIGESKTFKVENDQGAFSNLQFTLAYFDMSKPATTVIAAGIEANETAQTVTITGKASGINTLIVKAYNKFKVSDGYTGDPYSLTITVPVRVGAKATGISASDQSMGVGQTFYPAYKLTPTTALDTGVYYAIEPMTPADLGTTTTTTTGTWLNPNTGRWEPTEPVTTTTSTYTEGAAITDNQLSYTPINGTTPSSSPSKDKTYEGSYIEGVSAGRVKVSVRPSWVAYGGKPSATFYLDIKAAPTGITVDTTKMIMLKGTTQTRKATLVPSDAGGAITYASDDSTIAKVDANGKVTAVGAGTTTIRVKHYSQPRSYEVQVYDEPKSIKIADGEPIEIGVGETQTFGTDIEITYPENPVLHGAPVLTYTNLNTAYLTLSGAKVTGKAVTTKATVEVSAQNDAIANANFYVLAKPYKITFDVEKQNVGLNEDYKLVPTFYRTSTAKAGEGQVREKLTWTSSNKALATVDEKGNVHIVNNASNIGKTVTVKATSVCGTAIYAQCVFTIKAVPTGIAVDQSKPVAKSNINTLNMAVGTSVTFAPRLVPSEAGSGIAVDYDPDYICTDKTDADYDTKPFFLSKDANGNYTIVALRYDPSLNATAITFETYNGTHAELSVNVLEPPDDIEPFEDVILAVGMTHTIVPVETVPDTKGNYTFKASNTAALTVNATTGVIKANQAVGSVTVTVSWPNGGPEPERRTLNVITVKAPDNIRLAKLNQSEPGVVRVQQNLASMSVALIAGDDNNAGETYKFAYYFLPNTDVADSIINHAISDVTLTRSGGNGYFSIVSHEKNEDRDGGVITLQANRNVVTSGTITLKLTTLNGKTATVDVTVRARPKSIGMTPDKVTLIPGKSATLKATVAPAGAGGEVYYEAESDVTAPDYVDITGILTVNYRTGVVKVDPQNSTYGTVKVYARSTGLPDYSDAYCVVTTLRVPDESDLRKYLVRKDNGALLAEENEANDICIGDTITAICPFPTAAQCKANSVFYEIDSATKVTYKVDPADKAYLSVTSAGAIKALKAKPSGSGTSDTAKVIATAETGATVTMEFNILPAPEKLTLSFDDAYEADIRKNGLKMTMGEVIDLEDPAGLAMLIDIDPDDLQDVVTIKATSSSAGVVSLYQDKNNDDHYTLKAIKAGTATITFSTYNGKKDSFKVISYGKPTNLKFSCGTEITLGVGMTKDVKVSFNPTSAYVDADFVLESDDDSKVSVNPGTGRTTDTFTIKADSVTGAKRATVKATVTLRDGSTREGVVNVGVLPGPKELELVSVLPNKYGDSERIGVGEARTITYRVYYPDGITDPKKMMTQIKLTQDTADMGAAVKLGAAKLTKTTTQYQEYQVVVTGLRPGEVNVNIDASNDKGITPISFTVEPAPKAVIFDTPSTSMTIAPGESYTFTYKTNPADAKDIFSFSYPAPSATCPFTVDVNEAEQEITVKASWEKNDEPTPAAIGKAISIVVKTYNGKSATIKFTARRAFDPDKDKITLSPATATVGEGYPLQLKYALSNSTGGTDVTFFEVDASGTPNGGSVLGTDGLDPITGIVTPMPGGLTVNRTAYVMATIDGVDSNIVKITVKPGPQEDPLTTSLEAICPGDNDIVMGVGESVKMVYQQYKVETGYSGYGIYPYTTTFTYTSKDPDVATYSGGTIAGKKAGLTEIALTAKNGNANVRDVIVMAAPTGLQWAAANGLPAPDANGITTIEVGDIYQLAEKTETIPVGSASFARTYATSNKAYVTVDATGKFTAVKATTGTTVITITVKTYNGKACTLKVKVIP